MAKKGRIKITKILVETASLGVGAAAATAVNKVMPSAVTPTMSASGKVIIGTVLSVLAEVNNTAKPINNLLDKMGNGVAAVGAGELTNIIIKKVSGTTSDDPTVNGMGAEKAFITDPEFQEMSEMGNVDSENIMTGVDEGYLESEADLTGLDSELTGEELTGEELTGVERDDSYDESLDELSSMGDDDVEMLGDI